MNTMMTLNGPEIAAWVAALAGGAALLSQAVTAFKKRKKERTEIEEALDHSPEVKHQLELGNVGEAVKHLNVIIESQARHIRIQDDRQFDSDSDIQRLKDRNEALEIEAQGWETRYYELEKQHNYDQSLADRKFKSVQEEMAEMKRSFARTLAQLRNDQAGPEGP